MMPPGSPEQERIARIRELFRRAVLTLAAIPDPDVKFLKVSGPQWLAVRDAAEAYGWDGEVVRFKPTPRDVQVYLDVLTWMSWYERERDPETIQLITAWAFETPWWRLTKRFSVSERTLRRMIDAAAAAIGKQFADGLQKIMLDNCHEWQAKSQNQGHKGDCAPPPCEPQTQTPTAWIAPDGHPSTDLSNPLVAASRQEAITRIERGNRKRARKQARARQQRY